MKPSSFLLLVSCLLLSRAAHAQSPETAEPEEAEQSSESSTSFWDRVEARAFADAYARLDFNAPADQTATGPNRGYDFANGASLTWAGIDLSYGPDPVGGVIQLRLGPSVPRLLGPAFSAFGFAGIKQAYASWKPIESLQLDLGVFDTIYGAEVTDSQLNFNYTRGSLYFVAQPFYHTGARATWTPNDTWTVRLLAVNGWNSFIDNNGGKTFGAQVSTALGDLGSVTFGYLGGPEQNETLSDPTNGTQVRDPGANDRWRHLVDAVLSLHVETFELALNADFVSEQILADGAPQTEMWGGAALLARVALSSEWSLAGRGELIYDSRHYLIASSGTDARPDLWIGTGTVTVDYHPSKNLIIRLDTRMDWSSDRLYCRGGGSCSDAANLARENTAMTLGVVATTD